MLSNRQGMTLVEVMVVVGIIGLLAAISVPAFSSYVRSNRLATSVDHLAADLQMARTTSIANGRIIRFAASGDVYRLIDMAAGDTLITRRLERGVTLAADASVRFFPWGISDAGSFNLVGCNGDRTVSLLPTGVVEVN